MPVIKAGEHLTAQCVPFNFEDMATQAVRYLEKVRAEAAEIVAQAKKEAAEIRRRAEAEGRQAGQQAIAEMVRHQLGQQLATLMPALQQAIQQIQEARQAWLRHWENSTVHLATQIAARIIRRQLANHPDIPLQLIREALELATGSTQIRLLLNPTDYQTLKPQVEMILREMATLGEVEVAADPTITPGGCRLETQFGIIDQQLETQLRRIEEELRD
ncbi:MAG: FliH/SctL family protein [Thermoguttaceae bacterium]|nr:FliH/SctL family protein [Thermoguttaceae bacterium]MDW8037261.1 FliH/SctL family protein [Thermoguttaceae bacterium]